MKLKRQPKKSVFDRDNIKEVEHLFQTGTKKEIQYELDHCDDKEWRDENHKLTNTPVLHLDDPDHPLPKTRRDFLAAGILKTSAVLTAPAWTSLLHPNVARAANVDCSAGGGGGGGAIAPHVPFITIDADGGFSVAGDNFMVGANNDPYDFLPDYKLFGVPDNLRPQVVAPATPFGVGSMPFHPQSKLLEGILARASATTLANTDGFLISVESQDDSSRNYVNLTHAAVRANVVGSLAQVVGTEDREWGGNQRGEFEAPGVNSIIITNEAEAAQLSSAGLLETVLGNNPAAVQAIVRGVAGLNEAQVDHVELKQAGLLKEGDVKSVVCGAKANLAIIGNPGVTVYADPTVQQAFSPDLAAQAAAGNAPDGELAAATLALMAIQGKSGPATLNVGQCDYHGNGRPRQDARDLRMGEMIGSMLELAALNNSPLFINLITDGSTSADDEIGQGSMLYESGSDNGLFGANVVIAYNPVAKPEMIKRQFGLYSPNGVVPNATPWASSPEVGARIVFANYLHVNNKLGLMNQIFPNPGFNVNDVIAFANKFK